ncbi:hypothetical protein OESDEN_00112 [Oesophagostomum dentatum]|uniref:Uncharacterized protein n=1 Tax=Oesophagostomum dentatum TaxID=61180 RepID=A0A0B1TVJ4_OESDE|nr:hypothetical protein OESDEN_00112 [Oesophagostomum dentatum]
MPSLRARMLGPPDSPSSEVTSNIQSANLFPSATKPSVAPVLQLPSIMCTPVRPAPRPPVPLTLDSVIPIPKEFSPLSEYVPMNPPKSMKIFQKDSAIRLPSIASSKPKISDPIPLIIAGRPVNEQETQELPLAPVRRPSQDFIASLEDALRAQTLDRRPKLSFEHKATTLPKPLPPDRADKPVLRPFLDSSKERLYDLPA